LLQSLPLLRNDENYAIASVSVRHRERSAAICLLALFSHPERNCSSSRAFFFVIASAARRSAC